MKLLDIAIIWKTFRLILEAVFGIYKKRLILLNQCGITSSSSILDIGCGDANFSRFFNGLYVGVDNCESYINAAKSKFPDKIFNLSVDSKAVVNNNFDCLLLMDVVHHLPDEVFEKILLDVKNLSINKKIIFDPIKNQKGILGRILCSLDRGKFIRIPKDIVATVISCGYKIIEIKYFKLGPTDCVMISFE